MIVQEMTSEDCAAVLSNGHIAHLGCCRDNQPYVVPIQYAFDPGVLYSFSMPGQKIAWLRENPGACLQVLDMHDDGQWRSVVVEGTYEEFPDDERWHAERMRAWSLLEKRPNWWEPGALKPDPASIGSQPDAPVFFAIRIKNQTGRRSLIA